MIHPIKKYLTSDELKLIASKIAETESNTSGEIRVCVRHKRGWGEGKLSLHDLTLKEFRRLGMRKTKDRTGVLILLLMSERKFEIYGDEGIHAKIAEGTWDRIAGTMTSHFKDGKFSSGIIHAIDAVGSELRTHFPRTPGTQNELSNDVVER